MDEYFKSVILKKTGATSLQEKEVIQELQGDGHPFEMANLKFIDDATDAGKILFSNRAGYEFFSSAHKMLDYRNFEELQKILSGYRKGIPSYSQHKGEVILDTEFYYMLNLQSFLSKFGGKKVKELITIDNRKSFAPIKQDLLVDRFKTYRDVGWYLANPATNMMKWIADKEKQQ